MLSPDAKTEPAKISTILTAAEQIRIDAAGIGLYVARHRADPKDVLEDVKKRKSAFVLLSVQCCEVGRWEYVSRMIREIPRIPTIAILTRETSRTPEILLHLGREGVREIVDIRSAAGWTKLRSILLDNSADEIEKLIMERLQSDSHGMTDECWTFFETLVRQSARIGSVRGVAEELKVLPSTLMSRFYRAGLPAPKQYLAMIRLIRSAYLFENNGFSIANVADHLDYSSPQSFGRHVRSLMGITALEFRRQFDGAKMLSAFEKRLVVPYRQILTWFRPFSGGDSQRVLVFNADRR